MTGALRGCIIQLLLGDLSAAQRAVEEIDRLAAWDSVITLANDWKVLPQLRQKLGKSVARLPEESRIRLQDLLSQAFVRTARCISGGADALAMLESRAIPCAAFKGVATLAYLYTGPGQRTLQDVDILVRPEQWQKALELLEANGFVRSVGGTLDEYLAFVHHSPGSAGNEAISLSHDQGTAVDLHWRLGRLDPEILLTQVQRATILGKTVPVVAPRHSLLLTVHHALRNDFVSDEIVRDLLDFHAWLEVLGPACEASGMLQAAATWGLASSLLAMERIVAAIRGVPAAWLAPHASAADLRKAADLAELYFHQVQFGALNTDLVYLSDPQPLLQVLAGAVAGWSRYRTMMKGMEKANGSADATLYGRLQRLAKAVRQLPVRRWRQVRALASAKQEVFR